MIKGRAIGIIKETKVPVDRRVAITPHGSRELLKFFPDISIFVEPSENRAFRDEEYMAEGFRVKRDLAGCDILIGVKEVDIEALIPDKTYLFFSHTAKQQPYNRELLKAVLDKRIKLIDYEYLVDESNQRLVAFGQWAGIVGAYNGLRAYGERFGFFKLKPAYECYDMAEMLSHIKEIDLPPIKIVITGTGRVASGALDVLSVLNYEIVKSSDFLQKQYNKPVICQLAPKDYVELKKGGWKDESHFFDNPKKYQSTFLKYTEVADLFIACHYWDQDSPIFFSMKDIKSKKFKTSVIADISCDIAMPIPTTIRPSTITKPCYGISRTTGEEIKNPYDPNCITVMAVDNLPCELPRDSSEAFSDALINNILHHLLVADDEDVIKRATIAEDGELTERYDYLKKFVKGK